LTRRELYILITHFLVWLPIIARSQWTFTGLTKKIGNFAWQLMTNQHKSTARKLKVLSYNILADGPTLALSAKHDYCPLELRVWQGAGGRCERILKYLEEMNADVMCLQECTPTLFEEMNEYLKKSDVGPWVGVQAVHEMPEGMLSRKEVGVATFVRHDLQIKNIYARPFREGLQDRRHVGKTRKRLRSLEDSGLILRLASEEDKEFVVGNCHIYWNPEFPNAKACQVEIMLRWMRKNAGGDPAVLCGDFNSTRHVQLAYCGDSAQKIDPMPDAWKNSAVRNLMTDGRVDPDHPEHPDTFGREKKSSSMGPLECADKWIDCFPDARFTTKTDDFCEVIDYIYHTPQWAKVDTVYPPGQDAKDEFPYVPDATHPSDHLPLLVTLQLD